LSKKTVLLVAVVFVSTLLISCGSSSDIQVAPTDTAVPEGTTVADPAPTCGPAGSSIAAIVRDGQRKFDAPPEMIIDPEKTYTATLQTSRGVIVIELAAKDAPVTTNNFVFLSCKGYFDGLTFHRVVKTPAPFVIQGGDPRGDGKGGPGYLFDDEISPNLRFDSAGVIGMANSGPNTNGSQFFITLAPATNLNDGYSAFGHVIDGMDTVNSIIQGDKILAVSVTES
jgi:cyclophilin family peptidyl-prolyl cis-trans isomerase